MLTVQAVYDFINDRAPFETQESYDNSGLLLGTPDMPVRAIHVALDVTDRVLDEAEAAGANLVVTHHPLMFHARKRLVETDREARLLCRMIRANMALISAHTNLDLSPEGTGRALAQALSLEAPRAEGFVWIGALPAPMTGEAFVRHASEALHTIVQPFGDMTRIVRRVGLCSGSGGEFWREALALGADAFVTGELPHHHALDLTASGMLAFGCGHFATENPGIFALADALQNWLNAVKYDVCVSKSRMPAYA